MTAAAALMLNMLVAVCPKIPYENSFNFEIRPGFQMTIMGHTNPAYREGLVSPTIEGFIINLSGDNVHDGLKVLHVNPRFDKGSTMVLNSKINYAWGATERHANHQMNGGQDFVLIIQAHEHQFKIFVNGQHFADFKYRKPLSSITGISIKGLVIVHQYAQQYELSTLPVPEIYYPSEVVAQTGFPIVLHNPTFPVEILLPGQMREGMVVAVVGVPLEDAWFSINWLANSNNWAFHLNPRLKSYSRVVMNTYFKDEWDPTEITVWESPFQVNKTFSLLVKTRSTHYEVWIDGVHYYDYKHREILLQDVNRVGIYKEHGNVHIRNVTVTY